MTEEWITVGSIAAGGFFGAISRFWISRGLLATYPTIGTLVVNLSGSFLLGFVLKADLMGFDLYRIGAAIGFCGSFTTFSTFMVEASRMLESGFWRLSFLYMAVTVGGSMGAIFLALRLCDGLA